MKRKPKHVIILGAGASATSKYPIADELKKQWLSSSDALAQRAMQYIPPSVTPQLNNQFRSQIQTWASQMQDSLRLFRQGGFGTIDEFCFHLWKTRGSEVIRLKSVLRLALGIHNPEIHFEASDYYPFIQKLFRPDNLSQLNDDYVILSFNYDVYLEWLLLRALHVRVKSVKKDIQKEFLKHHGCITSGFGGGAAGLRSIKEEDGFCVLKLHGMIAWPSADSHHGQIVPCGHNEIFDHNFETKLKALLESPTGASVPIVFPWEVFGDNDEFVEAKKFTLMDDHDDIYINGLPHRPGCRIHNDPTIHEIFTATWQRAREEVQHAKTISFVGLSMHPYLNFGFRYLFKNRRTAFRWTITDKRSLDMGRPRDPTSPTARIANLFAKVGADQAGLLNVYSSFEDFIFRGME